MRRYGGRAFVGREALPAKLGKFPEPRLDNDQEALKAISSGFQAGKRDRLTDDFSPLSVHPATLHRADSPLMRARARDLLQNNPFAKSGVGAYIANVIECGITPKPRFKDKERRKQWVDAWRDWSGEYEPQADITGQQTIYELQALWLEEVIVGGGCLMNFVELPKSQDRRIQLAIELIPEERFADEKDSFVRWNNTRKSANQIVNGVELDTPTGRHVRYWIKEADLSGNMPSLEPFPLESSDCRYAFFKKRIGQVRGCTLLHAAVMWLWKLGFYTDNEMMASAIKSCVAAVITTHEDSVGTLFDGDPDSSAVDAYGNALEKLQPGLIARLRPGEKISSVSPNVPAGDCDAWLEFIERSIAIGIDLSYEEFARDYSKGNFSSTRASANSDRKRFRKMQEFVVRHFCAPVYKRFAKSAALGGIDGFPQPADMVAAMDKWLAVSWRRPGWTSVNPLDDARADDIRLKNGTRTREEVAAGEGGDDWEEKMEQLDREQTEAERLNLRIEGLTDMDTSPSVQTMNDAGSKNGN